MKTVDEVLAIRAVDPSGLSRMIRWSYGVHIGVFIAAVLVPRHWLVTDRTPPQLMTINLGGGTVGPRSTGQTPIGGRPVEQVVPQPKRPEPIPPATEKPKPAPSATVTTPVPPPSSTQKPVSTQTRPPATGERVVAGSSAVETGAEGQSPGLTFGGGGASALVDSDFCCKWYLEEVVQRIQRSWRKDIGTRGDTIIQFTIMRDGTVREVRQMQSSGTAMLDIEARRALESALLNPIPRQVQEDQIVIRLTFPYGGI